MALAYENLPSLEKVLFSVAKLPESPVQDVVCLGRRILLHEVQLLCRPATLGTHAVLQAISCRPLHTTSSYRVTAGEIVADVRLAGFSHRHDT